MIWLAFQTTRANLLDQASAVSFRQLGELSHLLRMRVVRVHFRWCRRRKTAITRLTGVHVEVVHAFISVLKVLIVIVCTRTIAQKTALREELQRSACNHVNCWR